MDLNMIADEMEKLLAEIKKQEKIAKVEKQNNSTSHFVGYYQGAENAFRRCHEFVTRCMHTIGTKSL